MPSTKGLELLVRRSPLSDEEWRELIEARRSLINPHLDSFTLGELGEIRCLRSGEHEHALADDSPVVSDNRSGRHSLKTQGIFRWASSSTSYTPGAWSAWYEKRVLPKGFTWVWGLTRGGLWISAKVEFEGEPGYKDRGYERAKVVGIWETTPGNIVAATQTKPEELWKILGRAIKEWTVFRLQLYNHALELARQVEAEELALWLVQNR